MRARALFRAASCWTWDIIADFVSAEVCGEEGEPDWEKGFDRDILDCRDRCGCGESVKEVLTGIW